MKPEEQKPTDGPGTATLSEAEVTEIELKCTALAAEHKVETVYPVVMLKDGTFERVIAYIKEPNYPTKVYLMQQSAKNGIWLTGDEMASLLVIREASDPLTYGEASVCDPFKLGVARKCINIIDIMSDVWKKK